jgi:hypothetical protein
LGFVKARERRKNKPRAKSVEHRAKSQEQRAKSEDRGAWSAEHKGKRRELNMPPLLVYSLLYALCSMLSEGLSCEAFKSFDVSFSGLGNDLLGKPGGRRLLRPGQALQVIPQELLVKALLRAAGLVSIHGPESRGVGREDFVNENEVAVLEALFGRRIRSLFDRS